MAWSLYSTWRSGDAGCSAGPTWREKFEILPRVLPFIAIILGVLYAMYGGIATPSETAAVGALMCLMIAIIIYKLWNPRDLWVVLRDSTKESVMILFIIAAAGVFSYMLSSLFITQSIAEWIGTLDVNRWVLMGAVNVFLLIAGFFLPPVAVILMAAPILLPIITTAGFDPIWFAVVLTINMEIGLISPPVGLNLYVINGIAPDISLKTILKGSLPFVACMVIAIMLLCLFPGLATWLPNAVMGPGYDAFRRSSLDGVRAALSPRRSAHARGWPPAEELAADLVGASGETSGLALASSILSRYRELDDDEKLAFFRDIGGR
jgi:C4-dicarboxylate transporter DctM subunit